MKYLLINIVFGITLIILLVSCRKKKEEVNISVPFLTERKWISDTITINPPATYATLSSTEQQAYSQALAWFKNGKAEITFNTNATVTCGGDWDFGFKTWHLINNSSDIETVSLVNTQNVLKSWSASASQFSYTNTINNSFDCTFLYK